MAGGADDIVGHFRLAYQTVVRFPVLIVPPLAVAVLGFLLLFFIGGGVAVIGALVGGAMGGGHGAAAGGIAGLVLGMLVFGLVMGVLWLLSSGMVVVMARDALGGREPVLGDAFAAVVGRLGAVVVASGLVTAIMAVGFLFLVIPGFVAAVLLMFTLPAVLLDRLGAIDGIRRSVAVVRAHVGPVVGLVVGSLLVLVGVGIASWILSLVPFLGGLAAFVLHGAAVSYLTVVGVHFYQLLRERRDGQDRAGEGVARVPSRPGAVADPASGARVPGRGLRAPLHDAARAARRHDPGGPVHGRAREPGDRSLFEKYRRAEDYARADPATFEGEIRSTGFFRAKTRSVLGMARALVERHGGEVPRTLETLTALPGVGRKTANVVLGNAFGVPGIAVDTHVFRVTQRLGLAKADDPDDVEAQLAEVVPRPRWTRFCHLIQAHGRQVCHARTPACPTCPVRALCPWPGKTGGQGASRPAPAARGRRRA